MPFFSNKFSPKKTPLRKTPNTVHIDEQLFDCVSGQRIIKLHLGEQEITFENGDWIPENGPHGHVHKSHKKLEKRTDDLIEENSMLKLKYTVLLNMLTQTTADNHLQERELKKYKK